MSRRPTGCLPPLAVVAIIFVVVFGGWISGSATQKPPVQVSDRVTVPLELGWVPFGSFPADAVFSGVRITDATVSADVVVAEAAGARVLLDRYQDGPLKRRTLRPVVDDHVRREKLDNGFTALRVLYTAVDRHTGYAIEGELIAFTGPRSAGIVFDGYAEEGSFALAQDEILTMAGRTEITP